MKRNEKAQRLYRWGKCADAKFFMMKSSFKRPQNYMLKNLTMKKQKLLMENIKNRLNQCNRSDYIHQEWELKKQKKKLNTLYTKVNEKYEREKKKRKNFDILSIPQNFLMMCERNKCRAAWNHTHPTPSKINVQLKREKKTIMYLFVNWTIRNYYFSFVSNQAQQIKWKEQEFSDETTKPRRSNEQWTMNPPFVSTSRCHHYYYYYYWKFNCKKSEPLFVDYFFWAIFKCCDTSIRILIEIWAEKIHYTRSNNKNSNENPT